MTTITFAFDSHPADPQAGFDIGWDHAHHGLVPPAEQLHEGNPVRQGWQAGKACFGLRTLSASRLVRQWLRLRLHAWLRGRAFDTAQVTPNYLGQIDMPLCPITRQALAPCDASIDRVCDHAGYAAGNLAVMSRHANRAKGASAWDEALVHAQLALAASDGKHRGLDADAWARVAVLVSFVTPLEHAAAARLPLRVLPPNRLRLLNPVQGLQALVTRELGRPDGMRRLRELAALLPLETQRADFGRFLAAMLPRLIGAEPGAQGARQRHALEDAWCDQRVNRCWQRFAVPLQAALVDRLLAHSAAVVGCGTRTLLHDRALATEGWALDTRGAAIAPAPVERRRAIGAAGQGRTYRARITASSARTADGHLPA